jgi:Protein of unknown function (DUF3618)
MEPQSARFEREAEETLRQLSGTLEELRGRMTPGRVVDQVIDYTRDSPAADFLRNIGQEVRQNPMPLVLVGIGILWLLLASNRTSRAVIASAADRLANNAEDISVATTEVVSRTTEWGQQTAVHLADRASEVVSTVGNTAAKVVDRARDATGGLAEKARSASAGAVTTFARAKRSITGASADSAKPMHSYRPASSVTSQEDAYADEGR